jgi:hypothetical protein
MLDLFQLCVFNLHVSKLAGFEDFAAFQAFDKFGVIFAGDDFHARMLTVCHLAAHSERLAGRDRVIDSGQAQQQFQAILAELAGIFSRKLFVVKPEMKGQA